MSYNIGSNANFNNHEAQNVVMQNLAADPTGVEGLYYYNTVSKKMRQYQNGAWADVGGAGGGGDVVGPAASIDGEVVLFNSTTGKLIKRSTLTGIPKLTSGVQSAAVAGTDYTTPSSTESPTNKTFNANGTGNTLSNVETADFAANVIDTDTTLAANSDTRLATQKATKAYVDNRVTGVLDLQSGTDASTNPNYPAAIKGEAYYVTVAGKIGGASGKSVDIGDLYVATADNAGGTEAAVGTSWIVLEHNLVGALLAANNLSDITNAATAFANIKQAATTTATGVSELATQAETFAQSDTTRAVTPVSLVGYARTTSALIGDNATTNIVVTHGLNTKKVHVSVRKVSTDDIWLIDANCNTVNQVTLRFAVAPTTDEFEVTIIG